MAASEKDVALAAAAHEALTRVENRVFATNRFLGETCQTEFELLRRALVALGGGE